MTGKDAEQLFDDIQASYEVALIGEKIPTEIRRKLHATVQDWFVNNVEYFVSSTDADDD